jgi:hypothetical protein
MVARGTPTRFEPARGCHPLSRGRFVGSRASGRIDRFGTDHNPTTRTEPAWAAAPQPDRQLAKLVTRPDRACACKRTAGSSSDHLHQAPPGGTPGAIDLAGGVPPPPSSGPRPGSSGSSRIESDRSSDPRASVRQQLVRREEAASAGVSSVPQASCRSRGEGRRER